MAASVSLLVYFADRGKQREAQNEKQPEEIDPADKRFFAVKHAVEDAPDVLADRENESSTKCLFGGEHQFGAVDGARRFPRACSSDQPIKRMDGDSKRGSESRLPTVVN